MPNNHGPIAPHQQRAFEAARRAAMLLCPGYDRRPTRFRDGPHTELDPETTERARWLVVAMGVARGTPGGLAVAAIARRGYVVVRTPILTAAGWRPVPFDYPGIVYVGEPLPRRDRPWAAIEKARCGSIPPRCRSFGSSPGTRRCGSSRSFGGKDTGSDEPEGLNPLCRTCGDTPIQPLPARCW